MNNTAKLILYILAFTSVFGCTPKYFSLVEMEEIISEINTHEVKKQEDFWKKKFVKYKASNRSISFDNYEKYSFKITPHVYFKNYKETTTLLSTESKFINDDLLFNIPIDTNFMDTTNFINQTWNTIDVYMENDQSHQTNHFTPGTKLIIVSTFGKSNFNKTSDKYLETEPEAKKMVIMFGKVMKNNTSSAELDFMVVDYIYHLNGTKKKKFNVKSVLINREGYAFLVEKNHNFISTWAVIDYGILNKSHVKEIYSLPSQFGEPLMFKN